MITKKSKRFMAVLFTTIMTIGSATSAFASEANPVDPTVAMLTNYNTPYTTTITANPESDTTLDLKVTGMNNSYEQVSLSDAQAKAVTWSVKDGGTITPSAITPRTDGTIAAAEVTIPASGNYGYAVVEAELKISEQNTSTFDFAIVVNPQPNASIQEVNNIKINIKVGDEVKVSKTLASVGGITDTDVTLTKYPTALSALLALQNDPESGISDVVANGGYLTSLKIGDDAYPTAGGYWMYSVEDAPLSAIVGAADFQLETGDEITWTCTCTE